jgi:enolase
VRGERLAKYNQLLRIEEAMAPQAVFAGRQALACRCESTAKDQ